VSDPLQERARHEAGDRLWQKRMLPLMTQVVLGLAIFFFVVSLVQLTYLHARIREAPGLGLTPAFTALAEREDLTFDQRYSIARMEVLVGLDAATMQRRYHQVNASLMARVWTRYMGFVTGMILSVMGALFILGKIQEPTSVSRTVEDEGRFVISTASPGLILTVLGMVLMMTAIMVNHRIDTSDVPGFVRYLDGAELNVADDGPPPVPAPADLPSFDERQR